jgi:hypothetical protein
MSLPKKEFLNGDHIPSIGYGTFKVRLASYIDNLIDHF